jgi:poly-gamma-glutamate synthesis protein (capsule biosynthesis protein)
LATWGFCVAAVLALFVAVMVGAWNGSPPAAAVPSSSLGAFLEPGTRYSPPPAAVPDGAVITAYLISPTNYIRPFNGTVEPIPAAMATQMIGTSWREGCPVAMADLRLVRQSYWGFDNAAHQGEMVIHADVADEVVRVFKVLYDSRVPVRSMRRLESYGGSLDASMAADNTSGFGCRAQGGTAGAWTPQSYGRSVDLNPVENPRVGEDFLVAPAAGLDYADRRRVRPGMMSPGGVAPNAFAAEGFRWGGTSAGTKEYQHFQS